MIIPWGENGAALCTRLRIAEEPWEVRYLARRLQRRNLETLHDKIYVLTDMTLYSETIGLLHQDGSGDEMQEFA